MWGIGTPSLRRAEEIETNRRYISILNNLEEPTMKKTGTKKNKDGTIEYSFDASKCADGIPLPKPNKEVLMEMLGGLIVPQWRTGTKYIPGLYLVMGHEGKGISAHYTMVMAGLNNSAGFFVDHDGDMVKPFTISAAYGPIPESK